MVIKIKLKLQTKQKTHAILWTNFQRNLTFIKLPGALLVTSNNEHGWTLVKYLNILHHNKSTLGTLDMSGHFHQKQECQLVETLVFVYKQKMNSIANFFFEIL